MDPLSKDASDALKALGEVEPTARDEARVRDGVERALGLALPVASAAVVTTAVSAKAASMTLKMVLLTVASFGAGVAVTVALRPPMPQPMVAVPVAVTKAKPIPPPEVEDVPVLGDVQPELVLRAPPPMPRAPVVAKKVAPVAAPAPVAEVPAAPPPPPEVSVDDELNRDFSGCDLQSEQRLASHVRSLIPQGTAGRGLDLLTSYQRRCATGHWAYDSWVARFDLLCSMGRKQEFTELWQWFRVENDRHAERLQEELRGRCQF